MTPLSDIYDDIKEIIESGDYSEYAPNGINVFYDYERAVPFPIKINEYPVVVITEIERSATMQTKGEVRNRRHAYQIDIYSNDRQVEQEDGTLVTEDGHRITRGIGMIIDDLLTKNWFTNTGSPNSHIANIDPTIARYCMRFTVYVDSDNIINRR